MKISPIFTFRFCCYLIAANLKHLLPLLNVIEISAIKIAISALLVAILKKKIKSFHC